MTKKKTADDWSKVSRTDLDKIMIEENARLEQNIVGELHDYLKKKDDRINDMGTQIESLEKEVSDRDKKIEQLKKIVSDALDKI